jgi:hypothetical protein
MACRLLKVEARPGATPEFMAWIGQAWPVAFRPGRHISICGESSELSELSLLTLFQLLDLDLGGWSLEGTPFAIFRVVMVIVIFRGQFDVWFKL